MKIPFTDQQLLELRQAGRLPRISIAEDDFIVAWEHKRLELETDRAVTIDLDNLALSEDMKNYLCFYNQKTRSVVHIPEDITRLPKDTVLLEIPNENFLDPVAVARQYGQRDTFLLDIYPIRTGLKAKVIPLESSGLPELVRINIERKKGRGINRLFGSRKNKTKGM